MSVRTICPPFLFGDTAIVVALLKQHTMEMDNKNFYITTTLPYVNADPHMGHAMEFIRADVIARTKKLQGYDVFPIHQQELKIETNWITLFDAQETKQ